MKRTLLRIATALYFSLGLGVMGALAGLGWSFAFPAQYTSTAQVPVNIGQFAGDYPAASAYVQELVEAARDPQALSAVIVMQNLYRPSWSNQKLGPLVDRMRREIQIHSHTNLQNAAIDLSFTYPDRYKVQPALDRVIFFIADTERQRNRSESMRWRVPLWSESHRASQPVRTSGLEQGMLVLLGFSAGLMVSIVISQVAPRQANLMPAD
jgi:hypothetical protein